MIILKSFFVTVAAFGIAAAIFIGLVMLITKIRNILKQ